MSFTFGVGPFSFSWDKGQEKYTPTKRNAHRPGHRDLTGGLQANEDMLRGLYHGTWMGLQFASPLAFTPINLPVQMMGLPTPKADDDDPLTQQRLNEITDAMSPVIPKINRSFLLVGTAWRFPRFDSKSMTIAWEEIPDKVVQDIIIDVITGRPVSILTDEMIKLATGENRVALCQRKRTYTRDRVDVRWYGERPLQAVDYSALNVAGGLPVAFAHDADENEVRGYSALARIIRDLKDYHDTDYRVSNILTRFVPKQVQNVESPKTWREENGLATEAEAAEYDIATEDLVINRLNEATAMLYLPEGATSAHEKALERKYWKIVEGSGIPEIFWGLSLTGNHADGDNQVQKGVKHVDQIRDEVTAPYHELYAQSLRVLSVAYGETYKPFKMGWNELESISAETKSKIFLNFAQGVAALIDKAGLTDKMLHSLWEATFPKATPDDFAEFKAGLGEMAVHRAALEDYALAADIAAAGGKK
jgi:hypothetical protein